MYCVMASTRTVALVVVLSSFSSPVVFGHTHDAQSALERYQNAVTLANGGHHAQAREVYAQLLANYPGQLEFAMGFAKSCVASNVPEQLFVKLQHMSQIFIGKIFESGSRISERRSIAKYLKEFDANTQKAIFMLQSKPVSPQNVYTLRMWRGNILHGVSLAMLSTDSRSQWGRRMMTLAHTTKMAAVAEVEPGGICRGRSDGQGKGHTDVEGRQLVWGWEQKVLLANDDDVTVGSCSGNPVLWSVQFTYKLPLVEQAPQLSMSKSIDRPKRVCSFDCSVYRLAAQTRNMNDSDKRI
eukprot:m.1604542 g.1604542  ORF g.1604542 m.1604542 type:complete len:297 (-) comp25358_c0_seq7:6627-7517(-)